MVRYRTSATRRNNGEELFCIFVSSQSTRNGISRQLSAVFLASLTNASYLLVDESDSVSRGSAATGAHEGCLRGRISQPVQTGLGVVVCQVRSGTRLRWTADAAGTVLLGKVAQH